MCPLANTFVLQFEWLLKCSLYAASYLHFELRPAQGECMPDLGGNVYNQPNVGESAARNSGISCAKFLISVITTICIAIGLSAACAAAQTPTGSVVGTVIDAQGLAVQGATVVLTNEGTNYSYTTTSGSNGEYRFSGINEGHYSVAASKSGFKKMTVANIKLDAATEYSVPPITLGIGTTTQEVVVQGGAELVNTTSTEVTTTVEKQQINDLPILDRNVLNLLELEPGITQGFTTTNYSGEGTEVAGGRPSFTNMTLDGINIQDNLFRENDLDFSPNLPFSSQAQEFTVVTQNSGVENGGGSSQVSVVTPQGTNAFHGEGFYYYRTNAWGANTWFNNADGVPLPRLIQNQGGGNFGGPIKKNKLFFYGYYELVRDHQQTQNLTTVLSPGIISAVSGASPALPFTYQPVNASGSPVGAAQTVNLLTLENTSRGGAAPVFAVDPAMLALIQRIPTTPNSNSCGTCDGVNILGYQLNARSNATQDNYGVRVDYNLNASNSFSGTWAWNRQIVDRPDIDTSFDAIPLVTNNDSIKFLSTAWRWSHGANFTNQVRFGFNLAPAFFLTAQKFGSTILDDAPVNAGISPAFTDPNPNFLPQGRNTRTWAWIDNAEWVKGNHALKFGTQIQRITIFNTDSFGIIPAEALGFSANNPYGPVTSDFPAPSGSSISGSGLTNATAILASVTGILDHVSQTANATSQTSGYVAGAPSHQNYRQNLFGVYAGDTWRIDPKLTFTYGLRWDYYSPVDERDGLVLLPVVGSGMTIQQTMLSNATINFAGGPSSRGLYDSYWKGFSPNIGVAWDPFGNGKTAIRAGFSMNRVNDDNFAAANNAAAGNTGLSVNAVTAPLFAAPTAGNPDGITVSNPGGAQNVPVPPFGIPTSFATNADNATATTGFIGTLAGYGINPHLHPPYVEQWNFSVQRDIGWNTSLSVSYLGNHGVGLYHAIDLNQILLGGNTLNGAPANFIDDFNRARSNGFLALAANPSGGFVPDYDPSITGSQPLTFFPQLPGGGFIDFPLITNFIYQGQIGALEQIYHEDEFDSGFANPGPPNQITNFFPNPYIMGGDLLENQAFSTYHAGVVEVRRRFNRGLYFQANYTFGKTITDYPGSQSQFQPFLDNARHELERARAPFDITHAVKANFTYELPIGEGHRLLGSRSHAVGLLVDGWQTGSFITWQSGAPFSILSQWATFNRLGSRSANNTALATQTHQQLGSDVGVNIQGNTVGNITVFGLSQNVISPDGTGAPATPQMSCAPAVSGGFCNPQPGEVGNLPLYAFNGPAYFGWDLSAAKAFNVTERYKLTFRTEAFNALNHNVFAMPNQVINSPSFGQITSSVSTPRILQMSLRLNF